MDNYYNFQTRNAVCDKCGKTFKQKYISFCNLWSGECECVIAERKVEDERRKAQKRQSRIENNIRESGIPKLYRNSSFDDFTVRKGTEKAFRASKAYVERFSELAAVGKGIIFTGNTGSGKTHLAAAIGNALLADGYTVKFIKFVNLIDKINIADDYGRTEADIISELTQCKLLIIDDICITNISDKWKRVLYSIVDNRTSDIKPTIYTSNVTKLDEIKTIINEQVYDRISGSCAEIKVLASSYRQK